MRVVRYSFYFVTLISVWILPFLAFGNQKPESEKDISEGREWGETVEGMALSISTEKQKYALGEQIVLNVLLKNLGEKDVLLTEGYSLIDYRISVLIPGGKKSPLTIDGKVVDEKYLGPISSSSHNLKPGEMRCVEFVINKLYDFKQNGKYIVSVRRENIGSIQGNRVQKAIIVPSNQLKITIDSTLPKPEYSRSKPEIEHIWHITLEDRKIDAFRNTPQKRLANAKWFGDNKSVKAVPYLVRGIEKILFNKDYSSSTENELATISYALGQIGDPKGLPPVKKACGYFSDRSKKPIDASLVENLFTAYHGMALLGQKEAALTELNRIFKEYGPKMEEQVRQCYEEQLNETSKW